jgi:hypothetical protein
LNASTHGGPVCTSAASLAEVKEWVSIGEPGFSSGRIWQWAPVLAARSEDRLCDDDILFEGSLSCDAINDLDVPDLWLDL